MGLKIGVKWKGKMIGAYIGKKGGVHPYVRNSGVRDLNSKGTVGRGLMGR